MPDVPGLIPALLQRIIRASTACLRSTNVGSTLGRSVGPAAGEIRAQFVDEDLDHPNRVLLADIIFQAGW
jgi:hypothetical protein